MSTQKSNSHPSHILNDWSAQISFKHADALSSFSLFVYLGPIPNHPTGTSSDPNYAGGYAFYGGDFPIDGPDEESQIIRGYVSLNNAIVKYADFESLEPDLVVPFLKERINWALAWVGVGFEPIDSIPSLEVVVMCVPVTMTPGAEFPTRGEPVIYSEVTEGKLGGYKG